MRVQSSLPVGRLFAVRPTGDEGAVRVLAAAEAVIGAPDAPGPNARGLAATAAHCQSSSSLVRLLAGYTYVQKKVQASASSVSSLSVGGVHLYAEQVP